MKKQNTVLEVPGVYGARRRLCNPEKGQMYPDYHKHDCEEMLDKYRNTQVDKFADLLGHNKVIGGDLKTMYKKIDRLKFRMSNVFYG